MCGVTRTDKIRNVYIKESLKVIPVTESIEIIRLSWYEHEIWVSGYSGSFQNNHLPIFLEPLTHPMDDVRFECIV